MIHNYPWYLSTWLRKNLLRSVPFLCGLLPFSVLPSPNRIAPRPLPWYSSPVSWKLQQPKISNSTKGFSLVVGIHTLGRVFHYLQDHVFRHLHDRESISQATHGPERSRGSYLWSPVRSVVNIHGIRPDIHKYDSTRSTKAFLPLIKV